MREALLEAPKFLPLQLNFGKEQFVNVKKYAANSLFDIWLKKKLDYVSPYFASDLPKALIHGDVFSGGGGGSASASFKHYSVIGQPSLLDVMTSPSFQLKAGFLSAPR